MPFFHFFPLGINIQGQRTGNSFAFQQFFPRSENKGKARNSLYTLIGTTNQKINTQFFHIDRNPSKTTHGINDSGDPASTQHLCNFFNRIQ